MIRRFNFIFLLILSIKIHVFSYITLILPVSADVCSDDVVDDLVKEAYIGEAKREINYFNISMFKNNN